MEEQSQPKSITINSIEWCGEEWLGKFIHLPMNYNQDFYIHEKITNNERIKFLFWYIDKKDKTKGSWRISFGDIRDLQNSCQCMADPESEEIGYGEKYLKYQEPIENKFKNFDDDEAKCVWEK